MSTGKTHHVAHHFANAKEEFEACKLGIWLFLLTEILMFGGLFVCYGVFHNLYPNAFQEGAQFLDWKLGALNTVVLLLSSFTMALGVYYSQMNKPSKAVLNLCVTVACGFIFMLIKYFEYSHKFHIGVFPGSFFSYEEFISPQLPLYFSLYFCLTGLHGIHVLIGMGLITWVIFRARKGEFSSKYYTPVEGVGLFWHLVDLVWIYLFPMLYLVG